jgi:alpha-tubulin suppressor-like RCC1 family protein
VTLAPGLTHTCALHDDGGVTCWGSDFYGALGRGPAAWSNRRYVLNRKASSSHDFTLGENHACVVSDPAPRCWGTHDPAPKELLRGPSAGNLVPEAAGATHIASAWEGVCAARPGAVICWGTRYRAGPHVSSLANVHRLAAGRLFNCAIAGPERKLWCWGWGGNFRVPSNAPSHTTERDPAVLDDTSPVVAVAAGARHACWARDDHAVVCTGPTIYDVDGEKRDARQAVEVASVPAVQALAAGADFTCMLVDGAVSCWGDNSTGALGNGTWSVTGALAVVKLPATRAIDAGRDHMCAVSNDGAVWCWGSNVRAQLGTGDRLARNSPVRVPEIDDAVAVSAANGGSCAIRKGGEVVCWGDIAMALIAPAEPYDHLKPARALPLGTRRRTLPIERIQQPP